MVAHSTQITTMFNRKQNSLSKMIQRKVIAITIPKFFRLDLLFDSGTSEPDG
jgi:hypothetical protein